MDNIDIERQSNVCDNICWKLVNHPNSFKENLVIRFKVGRRSELGRRLFWNEKISDALFLIAFCIYVLYVHVSNMAILLARTSGLTLNLDWLRCWIFMPKDPSSNPSIVTISVYYRDNNQYYTLTTCLILIWSIPINLGCFQTQTSSRN